MYTFEKRKFYRGELFSYLNQSWLYFAIFTLPKNYVFLVQKTLTLPTSLVGLCMWTYVVVTSVSSHVNQSMHFEACSGTLDDNNQNAIFVRIKIPVFLSQVAKYLLHFCIQLSQNFVQSNTI